METRSIGVCLINKNTNICENIASFESMEVAQEMFGNKYILALEEHGYGIGDIYKDGVWSHPFKELTEQEKKIKYEQLSVQYIHDKYSYDDENKILREYLSNTENLEYKKRFTEYNEYVILCKEKAHKEVYSS